MIELPCCSVFPYVPIKQADTDAQKHVNGLFYAFKDGRPLTQAGKSVPSAQVFAQLVHDRLNHLSLAAAIPADAVLIPVPRSSTSTNPWPQRAIAQQLVALGLGSRVETVLSRSTALPKASHAKREDRARSTILEHVNSLTSTQGTLQPGEHVVLIDDLMTQGTQLMGCCKKLLDGGHTGSIWGFTPMYTCYTCITDLKTDNMAVKQGRFTWNGTSGYPNFDDSPSRPSPRGFGIF